jgi:hypothetical protein
LRGADERRRAEDARDASLKTVVEHLANVTERTQHIVRDEIELAKAEVAQKVGSIGRGAAVGAAAGVFVALAGLFFLQGLSWLFVYVFFDNNKIFWGFFMTTALLLLAAAVGGLLAYKFVKKGAPPVPTMAIDEARLIRTSVQDAASGPHPEPAHGPSRTLGRVADRRTDESPTASIVEAPGPSPAASVIQKPAGSVEPKPAGESKEQGR